MHLVGTQEFRENILNRLRKLTPEHKAKWGKLTPDKLVCHLSDQLRVALGDKETRDVSTFFLRNIMKNLFINLPMPVPKGKVKTVPEMLSTNPINLERDINTFEELLTRVSQETCSARHPAFGPLNHKEWCVMIKKHLEHHFEQFGL